MVIVIPTFIYKLKAVRCQQGQNPTALVVGGKHVLFWAFGSST